MTSQSILLISQPISLTFQPISMTFQPILLTYQPMSSTFQPIIIDFQPGLLTSLDLETCHWKIEGTFDIGLGYLANLQGILHYFISSQALGFYWDTQNQEFKPIRENISQYQIKSDLQPKSSTILCYL